MVDPVLISAAVEGILDDAVVRRIIEFSEARPGTIYGKQGKAALREKVQGYNNAARITPWIVLVDLDNDTQCPPALRRRWLPNPAPRMCLRIVVREVEAWLMADAAQLSAFLSVARSRIPIRPEDVENPKREMVNLARHSRRKDIKLDMEPREGSGREVGPAYTSRMVEFVNDHWRPKVAMKHAEGLRRAVACIRRLARADQES